MDIEALPADAWERSIAMPLLIHFGLGSDGPAAANEEDEVNSAEIRAWYEDYQQKLRTEGEARGEARAVLTVLEARGLAVPDAARERILARKDLERLERWLKKAVVAASVAEVLDEPS